MTKHCPPYLGAAFYPEAWPDELLDEDIGLMRESGCNVMRIGEFAWHRMEPREGAFEFAWLHRVVEFENKAGRVRLARAGVDLLTGKRLAGTVRVPAYGVLVLREKS